MTLQVIVQYYSLCIHLHESVTSHMVSVTFADSKPERRICDIFSWPRCLAVFLSWRKFPVSTSIRLQLLPSKSFTIHRLSAIALCCLRCWQHHKINHTQTVQVFVIVVVHFMALIDCGVVTLCRCYRVFVCNVAPYSYHSSLSKLHRFILYLYEIIYHSYHLDFLSVYYNSWCLFFTDLS